MFLRVADFILLSLNWSNFMFLNPNFLPKLSVGRSKELAP
jgi:hypothetical protein